VGQDDKFRIVDEQRLESKMKASNGEIESEDVRLGGVITIYRYLRENYEYSLRYEEADRFFKREMELKRQYREKIRKKENKYTYTIIQNDWFRKNLSLTGLYYNLSEYGLKYEKPAIIAVGVILFYILYNIIHAYLSLGGITPQVVVNEINGTLTSVFKIPEGQDVIGFFIGIATIPILGALFVAAVKRKFEKKFRK
jgi:hypothetical protein